MVDHTHGEDGIETAGGYQVIREVDSCLRSIGLCGQSLQRNRQDIEGGFGQVDCHGALLHHVTQRGIDPDHPFCAAPQHAPAVVAVAAAYVQDGTAG